MKTKEKLHTPDSTPRHSSKPSRKHQTGNSKMAAIREFKASK